MGLLVRGHASNGFTTGSSNMLSSDWLPPKSEAESSDMVVVDEVVAAVEKREEVLEDREADACKRDEDRLISAFVVWGYLLSLRRQLKALTVVLVVIALMLERAAMVVMVGSGGGGGCEGEREGFVCCFSGDVFRCQCNQLRDLLAVRNGRPLPSILKISSE